MSIVSSFLRLNNNIVLIPQKKDKSPTVKTELIHVVDFHEVTGDSFSADDLIHKKKDKSPTARQNGRADHFQER
tara:strand:+ start:37452 stop:37673 length:222 start_codon:yes stop_codon:yes gene_type:complete